MELFNTVWSCDWYSEWSCEPYRVVSGMELYTVWSCDWYCVVSSYNGAKSSICEQNGAVSSLEL